MKYKFQVMIALTYEDKDIEVEVDLSDDEVARIKELVAADFEAHKEAEKDMVDAEAEEDYGYESPQDLLQILDDNDHDLFNKFWNVIFPPVFVECLIDAFANSDLEKHEDDNFRNYRKADFNKLYQMYGDTMELDHDTTCLCRVPQEWMT